MPAVGSLFAVVHAQAKKRGAEALGMCDRAALTFPWKISFGSQAVIQAPQDSA